MEQVIRGYNNTSYGSESFSSELEEPDAPLLEELGINFENIKRKTLYVLIAFKLDTHREEFNDNDITGPFFFALLLGTTLLLRGKWVFGYIYGLGIIGTIFFYFLLNMVVKDNEAEFSLLFVLSVLGYSLCPLSLFALFSFVFVVKGIYFIIIGLFAIVWCVISATSMLTYPHLQNEKQIIAYPLFLFYSSLALLIFF